VVEGISAVYHGKGGGGPTRKKQVDLKVSPSYLPSQKKINLIIRAQKLNKAWSFCKWFGHFMAERVNVIVNYVVRNI
jgi:hypothetical protein